MSVTPKQEKWNQAYASAEISTAEPAQVLKDNAFLLSNTGTALDLACGRAGNALFLAKQGYEVDAIDNSAVVLEHIEKYANANHIKINSKKRDLKSDGLSDKQYDVIVVSFFLQRGLSKQIIQALKPSGLLFYQTWSQLRCDETGPSNPKFRLEKGELLNLFSPLTPVIYHEHGLIGDLTAGLRNQAMLVAQKNLL